MIADVELGQDVRDVVLDGAFREVEAIRDPGRTLIATSRSSRVSRAR